MAKDKGFRVTRTAAGKVKGQRGKGRGGKVETTTVDPRVMRAALRAAGGDTSRLVIKSRTRVEIKPK